MAGNDQEHEPLLVLVTGPPGTGKSTLAERAAAQLNAPVLGWDWAMAALTDFATVQAAISELSHLEHRRLGWSLLWNLATAQLRRGSAVVLDGVARANELDGCRDLASREHARLMVVVTSCSDRTLHRRRVESRQRNIPGWHELDWSHVDRLLSNWSPPEADVYLDAVNPLVANASQLEAMLNDGR